MTRLLVISTFWIALLLPAISILTSASPEEIHELSLLWFAFPYLWLATGALTLVLLVFRMKAVALIYLAAMLITLPDAMDVVGLYATKDTPTDSQKEKQHFSFMTYNTHYFDHLVDNSKQEPRDSLVRFIKRTSPDVLCLQEIPIYTADWRYWPSQIREALADYPYFRFHRSWNGNEIIYSRFPLEAVEDSTTLNNNGILHGSSATDITLPNGQKVRLFNSHLCSLALSDKQINSVLDKHVNKARVSSLRGTLDRLMEATKIRATEARQLARAIENSPIPVVVCGDFNDIPTSYTYHKISHATPVGDEGSTLKDAYKPRHIGLAKTYRGNLPPLRIDYIFTSHSLSTARYEEHDNISSDHKAVSCEIYY